MSASTSDQVSEQLMHTALDMHANNTHTLLTILDELLARRNYTNEDMRGLKTILKHLKSGGNANLSSIDIKDAEAIGTILKSLKVPFATMRDGDTNRCIIVTRDTERDRALTREAFKRFAVEKGADLQQIPVQELLDANENKQVKYVNGLSAAALEVFKEHMRKYKGQYSVVRSANKDGLFDVYYPHQFSRDVENALKDMSYDLAGQDGRRYEQSLEDYVARKGVFGDKLNPKDDETLFVVSKSDPTRFITISKDGYEVHRAKCTKYKGRDGQERLTMADKFPIRHTMLDRRELFDTIQSFVPDAVILSQEEMGIVSSISANGTCLFVPDNDFSEKLQSLTELLKEKRSDLPMSPAKRDFSEKPVLTSYMKLERPQLDMVVDSLKEHNLDKQISISDDGNSYSIAFPEDNLQIKNRVDAVLFGGLSKIDSLNQRMYNEGRAVSDFTQPGHVIIDVTTPKACICITEEGATIAGVENGKTDLLLTPDSKDSMKRESPEFGDNLAGIISGMKEPVALTREEYDLFNTNPEGFYQILDSRLPHNFDTPAEKEYYRHSEQKEKAVYEELHKHDNTVDMKDLPERSQEAIKNFKELEIREMYVDRTFSEKVQEWDFNDRKMVDRSFLTETTTTSVER